MLTLPVRRLILSPATLADRLELAPEDRVLEIGAGPGYFSVEVARRLPRGHLTVLDLQPEMLERARERLSRAGVANVSFITSDAAALPFPDASFDVATSFDVFQCVPDEVELDPPAGLRMSP